ncbi:MAG: O-antigen ligase family protein [Coriobacteriia bacterium]|nr:O-antigen ligase family protein [Coriobacteriia bacterium]
MAKSGKGRQKDAPSRRSVAPAAPPMSTAQRVAWVALHVLVFSVPLAMGNWTWLPGVTMPFTFDQFDIVKVFAQRGVTLVAFAAWAFHILVNGGTVRRTKVDYLILVVLGWIALSTVFSVQVPTAVFGKYRRFEGLISFVNYATMYFLAVQFLDRVSRVRSLARTLFFSGTLVSFYGVLQYLGIDPLTWGRLPFEPNRAFSTYGNPDLLGGFLVIALPVALGLALSEKDYRWRIGYWAGFLLTMVCWIVAFTRGAWIGGAVALIVLGIAAWRMRTKLTMVDWSFSGGIAALSALVVVRSLASEHAVLNVWKRLVSIFDFGSGSALTRFQIWDAAWRATLDRPVFGFGPDTFRLVFPGYKPVEYVQVAGHISVADNVHNYFLQLATAIGIPGMLLLYGLFAAVAVLSFRTAFVRPESDTDNARLIVSAFWAAAVGYVVHLTFGISVTGSTFLLWIAMAALMAPGVRTVEVRAPSWGTIAAGAVIVVVAIASAGNIVYVRADNHYLKSRLGGSYEQRLTHAEASVRLNPYNDMYRAEVGVVYSDAFRSLLQQARNEQEAGGDPGPALEQAERVFRLAEASLLETIAFIPREYDNYLFVTNLYNLAGETLSGRYYADAIEWARKGIEVSEFGPGIRFQYAVALSGTGDLEAAERELLAAMEMDQRYVEPRFLLGDIYLRQGDAAAALEQLERVRELEPGYPGIDELIESAAGTTGAGSE